ncbi:hypothetical protein [Paenibacillus ihbetae]|uniref:hypothetical protein n=1 Tax=Paenibacillus ihbetae TaxID=1870820 RepID=UPI001679A727|nr:hypothetical protein [Paenibacillus ihbetae]
MQPSHVGVSWKHKGKARLAAKAGAGLFLEEGEGAVAALVSEPWGGAYIGFGRC